MRTTLVLALAFLGGCQSDNKVQNGLGVPDGPQGSDPGQTTPTTPTGTHPSTASTPTTTDDGGGGGSSDDTGSGGGGTDTGDLTDDELCQKAATLAGFLDKFQTPDDGKVVFCHSGSGSHYSKIDTDISACLPHLHHRHDVFPTTGCDS